MSTPNSPFSTPNAPPMGRPRALDDAKRREVCALVAGGCGLRDAARYVRCSLATIRREARRSPEFQDQLSRAEMFAQLSPLRAMQHACATHWRAAAWFLERAYPERFGRHDPAAFGPLQARRLLNEVLDIIGSEIADPFQHERIEKRLRATFEYSLRTACDRRRSSRDLRRAIEFFNQKDAASDPLAQFGFRTPDVESLFKRTPEVRRGSPDPAPASTEGLPPDPPADPLDAPVTLADLAAMLHDTINGSTTNTPMPGAESAMPQ
jgi:hypothetical protein